jgi:hypothetical protein
MMGNQKFPQQQMMGGAPGAMAQNPVFMQQQMGGGQPFYNQNRGGQQQYRQK